MLMTGARPSLFRDTYRDLKGIVPLEDEGEPGQKRTALREEELAKKIIQKLKSGDMQGGGIAHDAWMLSKDLIDLCKGDDEKMWRVINGVWVEMLCFSASRCRGYLHAKSLGKGGEYLSYIWLLQTSIGVETLAHKMQRTDLQQEEDDSVGADDGTAPALQAISIIGDESGRADLHDGGHTGAGADCTAPAIIGDKDEKTEHPLEEGDNNDTTPATTITVDKKTDGNGGSRCTAPAAPPTPVTGDENV
ncbi:unnamed protein product [Urochloa humidicola]